MLAHVSIEHNVCDQLPYLAIHAPRNILHDVAVAFLEYNLESACQVMVLKHTDVRVSDSDWMLSPYDELVGVPWMLIVVDDVGNKHSKDI